MRLEITMKMLEMAKLALYTDILANGVIIADRKTREKKKPVLYFESI